MFYINLGKRVLVFCWLGTDTLCQVSMERKEGDIFKYGAYVNRIQTSYISTGENGQSLECFRTTEISLCEKKV